MLDAKQRVAVAQDIVDRLKAGKVNVRNGVYVDSLDWEGCKVSHVSKLEETCGVCALGASVLAKLRLFDNPKQTIKVAMEQYSVPEHAMTDVFGEQAPMIEAAFEGWGVARNPITRASVVAPKETEQLACLISNPRERLELIMQDIADHEGEFDPARAVFEARKRKQERGEEVPTGEGQ